MNPIHCELSYGEQWRRQYVKNPFDFLYSIIMRFRIVHHRNEIVQCKWIYNCQVWELCFCNARVALVPLSDPYSMLTSSWLYYSWLSVDELLARCHVIDSLPPQAPVWHCLRTWTILIKSMQLLLMRCKTTNLTRWVVRSMCVGV